MTIAFIDPPRRIPLPLRFALWVVRRRTGRDLLPPRLLTWYPRAAVGSGLLEALVAHHDGRVTERMLKMVRMAVSFTVDCPFCMGMNSVGWEKLMTEEELAVVQGRVDANDVPSISAMESKAIDYARRTSQSPLDFPADYGAELRAVFTEREIVVLATTSAQVNYWARVIQALGSPPQF